MRKAALFDLDGTLIPGKSSENIFIDFLMKNHEFHLVDAFGTFISVLRNFGSVDEMFFRNKAYLKGKSVERTCQLAHECFHQKIDSLVPLQLREVVRQHKTAGDLLILFSGSLYFIVDIFAQALSFDAQRGTQLEIENGRFTGKIDGIHARGENKVIVLKEFVQKHNLDLSNSFAYGNSFLDRFWMEMVGNPTPVNPEAKLAEYAKIKGWNILELK